MVVMFATHGHRNVTPALFTISAGLLLAALQQISHMLIETADFIGSLIADDTTFRFRPR